MKIQSILFGLVLVAVLFSCVTCQCSFFENKIYQIGVNIPGQNIVYATVTFISKRLFHAYETLAENLNSNRFSQISGRYTCSGGTQVNLTGTAYYYVDPTRSYLNETGAIGLFRFELNFSADRSKCTGRSIVDYYRMGSNPYRTSNTPTRLGSYANNTCVRFR